MKYDVHSTTRNCQALNWIYTKGIPEKKNDLFAMVQALEVVVAARGALGGHGAVRHAVAEIHPHVVAAALLARDPKS